MTSPAGGAGNAATWFKKWLSGTGVAAGQHSLLVLVEDPKRRPASILKLREVVENHYVSPQTIAARLADLGAKHTAALIREQLPQGKTGRSGDMGEILATEVAEIHLGAQVPVRRLRWKDGRDLALRGDDLIAVRHDGAQLCIVKGEAKSRVALKTSTIEEADLALDRDRGRPTRHSVNFVAERLRESGDHDLAKDLEQALLSSFRNCVVEHFLFVLTASNPTSLLTAHISSCANKKVRRSIVGIRIVDHQKFIRTIFEGF